MPRISPAILSGAMHCAVVLVLSLWPLASLTAADEAAEVRAVVLERQSLVEELPLTGSVTAERVSSLSSQVEGMVDRVHFEVGDPVRAGEVLLELDAELRTLDRDRSRAEAEQARAEWEDARRRLDEGRRLGSDAIAASEVRALESLEQIARAQMEAAEATLARIEAELARFRIRAPFDGTLSARGSEEGEWITPGDALFELVALSPLRIDFRVPQRYYGRIETGARAMLSFDAYPGERFQGQILRKVPLSEDGSRTFQLQVTLADGDAPEVIPGMSVSGALQLDVDRQGLAIPRDAILRYQDGRTTVWVLSEPRWGESTQVREQRVELGDGFAGVVEVIDGLSAGDAVVTRGNEGLQEGQRVLPLRVDYEGGEL